MSYNTVIIADGTFPIHEIPLGYIRNAERIICCDGSTRATVNSGFEPAAIVGDMDSLDSELLSGYSDRIYPDKNQETNDLTKAVAWCRTMGYTDIAIVGATGKREDHTLGNISLLAEYCTYANIIMITDTGIFRPFLKSSEIKSFPGQQISIFSIDPETRITSHGLLYPLKETKLKNWWCGTLNEATGESFSIEFSRGRVIVYLKFR